MEDPRQLGEGAQHPDAERRRRKHPRHSAPAGAAARFVRNLVLIAVIGCVALLAAGLAYGDPRLVGLLEFRIGGGDPEGPVAGSEETGPAEKTGKAAQPDVQPGTADRAAESPPPGLEESDSPLGTPEPPAERSDSYKFLAVNADGTPVGYSPCRPLHYVVNADLAPEGAAGLVHEAIKTVSRATGIRFINDGATDEQPVENRAPYQPADYGDRWAPLLIAWTNPDVAPKLKGQIIGTGGSTHYSFGAGPKTFVTGSLELDAPQIAEELGRPDGASYATAVILHELSHVMGLEHVDDPVQLMYPEIGAPDGLASGDLNGLQELGKAQCRKDL